MDMKDFLNVLASKEPVPGGGGACGYVAAVGMALGNMVLSLTTGKKKYAEYQEEIEELIVKAGDITNRLYECMDKDAKAFKPLSEAYGNSGKGATHPGPSPAPTRDKALPFAEIRHRIKNLGL